MTLWQINDGGMFALNLKKKLKLGSWSLLHILITLGVFEYFIPPIKMFHLAFWIQQAVVLTCHECHSVFLHLMWKGHEDHPGKNVVQHLPPYQQHSCSKPFYVPAAGKSSLLWFQSVEKKIGSYFFPLWNAVPPKLVNIAIVGDVGYYHKCLYTIQWRYLRFFFMFNGIPPQSKFSGLEAIMLHYLDLELPLCSQTITLHFY